jgi:hypothetical protein
MKKLDNTNLLAYLNPDDGGSVWIEQESNKGDEYSPIPILDAVFLIKKFLIFLGINYTNTNELSELLLLGYKTDSLTWQYPALR